MSRTHDLPHHSTMTKSGMRVYVVAFEPKAEYDRVGVGGFDWCRTREAADRVYAGHLAAPDPATNYFLFSALVTSEETANDEIDAAWGEWSQFPTQPQPIDLRQPSTTATSEPTDVKEEE